MIPRVAFVGYECHWTNTPLVFAMIPRVSVAAIPCPVRQRAGTETRPYNSW